MSSCIMLSVWLAGYSLVLPLLSIARYLSLSGLIDNSTAVALKLCIESVICLVILQGRRSRWKATLEKRQAAILAAAIRKGLLGQV
jgi:hypothetical protein